MVKTAQQLADHNPAPEVDDFHMARAIVDQMNATAPHLQMWYMALWCARLREYYVEIGKDLT